MSLADHISNSHTSEPSTNTTASTTTTITSSTESISSPISNTPSTVQNNMDVLKSTSSPIAPTNLSISVSVSPAHSYHHNSTQEAKKAIPRITINSNANYDDRNYNQYACIRCRRLKKKCSKELPKCANCEKQNECCEYVERKNKRKSSVSTNPLNLQSMKKIRSSGSSNQNGNSISTPSSSHSNSISDNERESVLINSPSLRENSNNDALLLLSPRNSNSPPSIQLPPIRNQSITLGQQALKSDYLPHSSASHLSSYSLQQPVPPASLLTSIAPSLPLPPSFDATNTLPSASATIGLIKPSLSLPQSSGILPSIPKQVYNIPPYVTKVENTPSISPTLKSGFQSHFLDLSIPSAQTSATRPRANSKNSARSLSPTNTQKANPFNVPSTPITKSTSTSESNGANSEKKSNPFFQVASTDSIQYELMMLIIKKIGFVDENIVSVFMDLNLDTAFEKNFQNLLRFIIFVDKKEMLNKLNDFKENKFNWNGINQQPEDYYSSIEFLLLLTCSIILTCYPNKNLDPYYYKFTFTMAYKFLQRKTYAITNSQILRLSALFQLIAFFSNCSLEVSCFIQSFLTKYSLKWKLNHNMKKVNADGITLSDIEYTNRLFWCIFIFDSFIASTTYEQPGFQLNNIDVPSPLAIIKDEEINVIAQNIIINLSKIQTKILFQLYPINSKDQLLNDSDRFTILSLLRQDADLWYNDCRVLLSKLSEENMLNKSKTLDSSITSFDSFIFGLQNFAAWISQEYYYTLINLFKPSNMFPNPEIPNFTVISNATYQNTALLKDLVVKNTIPLSIAFFTRYANTSLYVLISLYKGTFTLSESLTVIGNLIEIWSYGDCEFAKKCYECIFELKSTSLFIKAGTLSNNDDIFKFSDSDNSNLAVKEIITRFINIMESSGIHVDIDREYIANIEIV